MALSAEVQSIGPGSSEVAYIAVTNVGGIFTRTRLPKMMPAWRRMSRRVSVRQES
jgi:hypothetical protein